ncbi:uncharacterized protein LOC143343541 [Colletes latitarsis]|uniref:uncharacterized protein LOC143343541 n=1 Tax=Colletes latitarsis TaxID=2605962 RepID=UPI0040366DFE
MLYMADNSLTILPDEVFRSLRYLQWLDIRNNQLSSLPSSIESHPSIETLLLQGNKIVELPLELCTLSNLKTLQVTQNPLTVPPKDIVVLGFKEILKFLTMEWNKTYPESQVEVRESKIEPKLSTILCYQSPRKSKKKVTPYKNTVRNKIVSTREKRKSYKPSNRYYDTKSASLTNINYIFKRKTTDLCDSCLNKTIDPETSGRQSNTRENTKCSCSRTVNSWSKTCVRTEINNTNNKILRLTDPSPRSLYVRQNVKTLKTYTKSLEKECRLKFSNTKLERVVPSKIETKFSLVENNEKYNSTENIDQIFDIITNDRKRFKLHSLRLQNPDWMLSCLENYIGIVKDQNVLKEWRRDRRSFNIAMEKAMKRNEDDIPFGFDPEDYTSIFKQKPKSKKCRQRFFPPKNINKKISDILESMKQLKIETADGVTPRTKQNLLEKEIEKVLDTIILVNIKQSLQ